MVQKIIPKAHNNTIRFGCKKDDDNVFIIALPKQLIV